jgi:hypothetical protein
MRIATAVAFALAHASGAGAQRRADELTTVRTRPIWRVGVDGGSAYENDVRFLGDGANDTYHRLGGALAGGVARGRVRAELDARGEAVRFVSLRDLDRETYDVGLTVSGRVTPRASGQLAVRALTSTTPTGIAQFESSLLPLVISRSRAAVASLVLRQSATVDATLAIDGTQVRFDETAFAGGHSIGALGRLTARPTAGSSRSLAADVRMARFDTLEIGTLSLDIGASQRVQAWTVQLTGGATLLQSRGDGARPSLRPTGAVEVVRPSRAVAITVAASRRLQAAFGFGQAFLTDVASVRLSHARPRSWTASVSADASRNVDPTAPELVLSFTSLTAELQRPIAGGLSLALAGYVRQRAQGQTFSNSGVSLGARFDTPR